MPKHLTQFLQYFSGEPINEYLSQNYATIVREDLPQLLLDIGQDRRFDAKKVKRLHDLLRSFEQYGITNPDLSGLELCWVRKIRGEKNINDFSPAEIDQVLKILRRKAESDPQIMFELGCFYVDLRDKYNSDKDNEFMEKAHAALLNAQIWLKNSMELGNIDAQAKYGDVMMFLGNVPEARKNWAESAAKGSKIGKIAHADALYRQRKYQDAYALYQEVLHEFPLDKVLIRQLYQIYTNIGKYNEAIKVFKKAAWDGRPGYAAYLGDLYRNESFASEDPVRAEKLLVEAARYYYLALHHGDESIRPEFLECALKFGYNKEVEFVSKDDWQRALRWVLLQEAEIYGNERKHNLVRNIHENYSFKNEEERAEVAKSLTTMLLQLSQTEIDHRSLNNMMALNQGYCEEREFYDVQVAQAKAGDETSLLYLQALAYNDKSGEVADLLGGIYEKTGYIAEAVEYYRMGAARNNGNALLNLAYCYKDHKGIEADIDDKTAFELYKNYIDRAARVMAPENEDMQRQLRDSLIGEHPMSPRKGAAAADVGKRGYQRLQNPDEQERKF